MQELSNTDRSQANGVESDQVAPGCYWLDHPQMGRRRMVVDNAGMMFWAGDDWKPLPNDNPGMLASLSANLLERVSTVCVADQMRPDRVVYRYGVTLAQAAAQFAEQENLSSVRVLAWYPDNAIRLWLFQVTRRVEFDVRGLRPSPAVEDQQLQTA